MQPTPAMTEEEKRRQLDQAAIQATGRGWGDLSEQEQQSLFANTESLRMMGEEMMLQPGAEGKEVGPYNLYMGPNWGDIAAGVGNKLAGGYTIGSANRQEAGGRKVAGDLMARRDALDTQRQTTAAERAERERRQWLEAILSRR